MKLIFTPDLGFIFIEIGHPFFICAVRRSGTHLELCHAYSFRSSEQRGKFAWLRDP